ncbi:hypothetical protein GW17_00036337 [Ensete ventricosum]|nr:hypothetical protein GW17_00036337 [Ensete ventricosum]
MRVKTSENNGEEKWRDVAHLDRQRKKKKGEALAFPKVYNHHESGRGRAYETKLGLYNSVPSEGPSWEALPQQWSFLESTRALNEEEPQDDHYSPECPASLSRSYASSRASLPQTRTTLPPKGRPLTTRFVDDLPRFSPESDQALLGDVARCPTPTPSASVCSFPDPDTLSSDSIDSLRVQLRLVNQRIDNVHKTIRMKDEHGESPLCGSPFLQEIKDTPIPQHFHLTMLEAYDGGSDPIEHVAAFQTQMALYGTSDTIISAHGLSPLGAHLLGSQEEDGES